MTPEKQVTVYIERAELFMDANSIPADKHVLTLLSSIGKPMTRSGNF